MEEGLLTVPPCILFSLPRNNGVVFLGTWGYFGLPELLNTCPEHLVCAFKLFPSTPQPSPDVLYVIM